MIMINKAWLLNLGRKSWFFCHLVNENFTLLHIFPSRFMTGNPYSHHSHLPQNKTGLCAKCTALLVQSYITLSVNVVIRCATMLKLSVHKGQCNDDFLSIRFKASNLKTSNSRSDQRRELRLGANKVNKLTKPRIFSQLDLAESSQALTLNIFACSHAQLVGYSDSSSRQMLNTTNLAASTWRPFYCNGYLPCHYQQQQVWDICTVQYICLKNKILIGL